MSFVEDILLSTEKRVSVDVKLQLYRRGDHFIVDDVDYSIDQAVTELEADELDRKVGRAIESMMPFEVEQ